MTAAAPEAPMRMIAYDDRSAPFIDVFRSSAERSGYALELIGPSAEAPPLYRRLETAYRHFSPNSPGFELACFRRWFEIAARVAADERIVHADSDLVIFTPWTGLPAAIREAQGFVASIGRADGVPEAQISPGFSVWTGALLASFCAFVVRTYEDDAETLAARHAAHPGGSISDMALLRLWVDAEAIPFFDINRILDGPDGQPHYIDHCIFVPEADGARFAMRGGIKAIRYEEQTAFVTTASGARVVIDSLHLVGRFKLLAEAIERRDALRVGLVAAYLRSGRWGRRLLARLGVRR